MARRKKRGSKIYAICLSIYILILCGAAVFGLTKVWGYAEEYEASRPAKAMDEYVAALSENLWDESIANAISAMPHEMQTDEECAEIVKSMLKNEISYSRIAGTGGSDVTANYSLRCGDHVFGTVTLKEDESKAGEVKYGMLPWIVYKEEFDFTGLYSSVQVTVPASYSVELNGHELGEEYIIESGIQYDVLTEYYQDYPNLPTKVTYKFDNIIGNLEPVILDENGNETVIDESRDDSQFITPVDEATLSRLNEFAGKFVERYKEYIAGEFEPSYGYQRLLPYVKLDSDLDQRLKAAQDGIFWSHKHGASVVTNSVSLNSAIYVGDGVYIIDISSSSTATTNNGTEEIQDNMKIIVTDTGSDIRAVTLELY